ncbi:hypothetical protein SRHO_G00004640 [Serrasalmus rhombeus]
MVSNLSTHSETAENTRGNTRITVSILGINLHINTAWAHTPKQELASLQDYNKPSRLGLLLFSERITSEPRCFWLKREAAAAPESNGDTACSAAAGIPYTMFSSTGRSLSSPPLNLAEGSRDMP